MKRILKILPTIGGSLTLSMQQIPLQVSILGFLKSEHAFAVFRLSVNFVLDLREQLFSNL